MESYTDILFLIYFIILFISYFFGHLESIKKSNGAIWVGYNKLYAAFVFVPTILITSLPIFLINVSALNVWKILILIFAVGILFITIPFNFKLGFYMLEPTKPRFFRVYEKVMFRIMIGLIIAYLIFILILAKWLSL